MNFFHEKYNLFKVNENCEKQPYTIKRKNLLFKKLNA